MTLPGAVGRGCRKSEKGLCLKLAEIQLEILRTCLRTWPTEIEAQPEPVAAAGNGNGFAFGSLTGIGSGTGNGEWETGDWRLGHVIILTHV